MHLGAPPRPRLRNRRLALARAHFAPECCLLGSAVGLPAMDDDDCMNAHSTLRSRQTQLGTLGLLRLAASTTRPARSLAARVVPEVSIERSSLPPPPPPHPKFFSTITRPPMMTRMAAGLTRPRRSTIAATPTHLRPIPLRAPSRRLAVDQLAVPVGLAGGLEASLPSSDSMCLSASLRPH